MPLSGLEIYKNLPKENCKECGLPTCLAFAMKVAAGQAALEACPRLASDAAATLSEASAPPQQLVKIGAGDQAFEIGQETVLYRHEDKFHHPTAIGVALDDTLSADEIEQKCREMAGIAFDRMGKVSSIELLVIRNVSGSAEQFSTAAATAAAASGRPIALMSEDSGALRAAAEKLKDARPLIWALNAKADIDGHIGVASDLGLPLCIEGETFEEVSGLVEKARNAGLKELILAPKCATENDALAFLTQSRRAAITKKFRPMGYPVAMTAINGNPIRATVASCWYILKYAGIVVTNADSPEYLLAMAASRQDIYTNPQVPVQVKPGAHQVGDPGPDAPVLLTTNFALSYYSVESEITAARMPAHIVAVDTEGTSVLTAWAAEKLTPASVAQTLEKSELGQQLNHKKIIIPGLVAVLSGGIKEESGWEVLVGPREASGIVPYLKKQWNN